MEGEQPKRNNENGGYTYVLPDILMKNPSLVFNLSLSSKIEKERPNLFLLLFTVCTKWRNLIILFI